MKKKNLPKTGEILAEMGYILAEFSPEEQLFLLEVFKLDAQLLDDIYIEDCGLEDNYMTHIH